MTQEIFELAQRLDARAWSEEEKSALHTLCRAAEEELCARLRPGVCPEECADAFLPAAAWLALSYFQTGKDAAGFPLSFTAGDVSVRSDGSGRAAAARELRAQVERLMAPYIGDAGFLFRGVEG